MASDATIAWLLVFTISLCCLHCGQTAGIQPCERIKPCTCLDRRVLCVNSSFSRVPAGIPSDTLTLDLSYNNIEEINSHELSHLHSLQKLILHHNSIKSIPSWDSFPSSLQVLSLHHNQIKTIPSFNTTKPHFLRYLYLHVNQISSIGADSFTNLTRLKTLRLNRNKLNSIPSVALSGLNSLITLDLRKNFIRTISGSPFNRLKQLKTLKLSKNKISYMEYNALFGLDKLEQLHLDFNNISVLQVNWFLGTRNLQKLFLQNNRISQINTKLTDWRNVYLLRHINLSGNRLYRIDEKTFRHLLALTTLNLANNNIYHITTNSFADLGALETLRLENNRISTIAATTFVGLTDLEELNLSGNGITIIEENAFNSIKKIRKLWLNTSDLTCNCKVKWLPGWIRNNTNRIDSVRARCRLPQHLQGQSIFNISTTSFVCDFSNPAPQIIRHPASRNTLIGQNVTLQCDVHVYQRNDSSIQLSWRHDYRTIKTKHIYNRAKVMGKNMVIYTSELKLVHVSFKDDGFYQCHAVNKFGEMFSNRAQLQVREFPMLISKPSNVTVHAGGTIHLPCAARGHPKPTISWRKDKGSTKFPAAEERRILHQETQDLFLITHSKVKDTGYYTCSATNDAGTVTARAYVTVLQIPRFMQSMTSKTVKEGESVVLECLANGNPKPHITWFKDRHRLMFNSRVLTHLDGQILVIIKVEFDDEGIYVCEVTNRLGTARQTAELTVITGDVQVKGKEDKEGIAFRYDKKTFLGIIVIVVVSCVVGTSLVWLAVIYCARRGSQRKNKNESLHTNTVPRDDVSYVPLKSYSSGSTQNSRDSPRSTATFITSSGSQGSTFPPTTSSSEQNCDCEKALTADTISSETSKGSRCSLASTCPSDESEPVKQVIHVQIHNSDNDSNSGSPSHRKEIDRHTTSETKSINATETSSAV